MRPQASLFSPSGSAGDIELSVLTPQVRETLQERVYRELRAALMRGTFTPGRSLTIRAVAAALGTSPMPVREALRQLVAERALVMLPNRSFGIPIISRQRFADLLEVRKHVEGFAAGRAAKHGTASMIAMLRAINLQMRDAAAADDGAAYIAFNQRFHFAIYEASGSPVLMPILESLWLQIGPYLTAYFASPDPALATVSLDDHHDRLIDALERGNAKAAHIALVADLEDGARTMIRHAKFKD